MLIKMNQLQLCVLIFLLGAVGAAPSRAEMAANLPISWSVLNEDGMERLAPMTKIFSGTDWDDISPPTGQEFIIGLSNWNETELHFPPPPPDFTEAARNLKSHSKSKGHSKSRTVSLPIELESFVGADKVEPLRSSKSPAFQEWLNEMAQETRKVERLMKAEKRNRGEHNHQRHLWSCETEYGWRNLGRDHYPQFIRTATCTSTNCFSDLFRCVPREYTLKVLKKLDPDEVVDHSTAVKLPEALRASVKFINVTTNICCECALG